MMNNKPTRDTNNENTDVAKFLTETAENINPNPHFATDLEKKLRDAHEPRSGWRLPSFKALSPSLAWVALMVAFGFLLKWSFQNLVPTVQPGTNSTATNYICPVTQPNGSQPPGETIESPDVLGNGEIWTGLWPNGRIYMLPENQEADGSFSMKWWWWRAQPGEPLIIEGRRLDASAEPLRALVPDGYSSYFQVAALIFPTTGCWEITGHVGEASLTFVTEVVFGEATPTPDTANLVATPGADNTPVANQGGYDWRGTKLFLNVSLPVEPVEANVFNLRPEQPATIEFAKSLAGIFSVYGELYKIQSALPNATGYLATDGRQRLYIESETRYMYYADYSNFSFLNGSKDISDEVASAAIATFMKSHNMDFSYRIERGPQIPGLFYVLPLTPDGLPVRHDYPMPSRLEFTLDDTGQVLVVSSNRVEYDTIGTYGIRTAEEAFQEVLDTSDVIQNGVLESMRSSVPLNEKFWEREYPDSQTITIYGQSLSYPAAEQGGAPFTAIGKYTTIGNIAGMPDAESVPFVKATGKFIIEGGVRKFMVEDWQAAETVESSFGGTLHREGTQVILTNFDGSGEYLIDDASSDLPLNTTTNEFLSVNGFLEDGNLHWTSIQYFPAGAGGGGGGGGGSGFYKLNLSGTPVPFPAQTQTSTSLPQPPNAQGNIHVVAEGDTCAGIASSFMISVEELITINNLSTDCLITIGQKLVLPSQDEPMPLERWEKQRGILSITIWEQADGGRRVQYGFTTNNQEFPYLLLDGKELEVLQQYNNRPVDVWGTVGNLNEDRMQLLNVEKFEIPFPDLQFQIMKGVAKTTDINGQSTLIFTEESGKQFIALAPNCYDFIGLESVSGTGLEGEIILVEALAIPEPTISGYPAICIFSTSMSINPKDNQPVELAITADQISILPEPPNAAAGNLPTAAIEKVELVYYTYNPRAYISSPDLAYVQPVWRFYGHYSNGDELEFLVQALKQEFLLPELIEATPPG